MRHNTEILKIWETGSPVAYKVCSVMNYLILNNKPQKEAVPFLSWISMQTPRMDNDLVIKEIVLERNKVKFLDRWNTLYYENQENFNKYKAGTITAQQRNEYLNSILLNEVKELVKDLQEIEFMVIKNPENKINLLDQVVYTKYFEKKEL